MHIQSTQLSSHAVAANGPVAMGAAGGGGPARGAGEGAGPGAGGAEGPADGRSAPLRVDAQRNLEHVLRAAREVFGELGYGAPMEDVARRARVGVGTVYRRFPSKEVLVRRIAEEETARLTEQARAALGQEDEPWPALSRFLRTSVASGAGRLLPPQVLRVRVGAGPEDRAYAGPEGARVPQQAQSPEQAGGGDGAFDAAADREGPTHAVPGQGRRPSPFSAQGGAPSQQPDLRLVEPRSAPRGEQDYGGVAALLEVVGQLVERARTAGELRKDVTVADVLLVIATAAPSLPDAAQQEAAAERLLDILLEGLRSRPSA